MDSLEGKRVEGKRQKAKGKRQSWRGLVGLFLLVGGWISQQGQAIADSLFPALQQWSFDGQQQTLELVTHPTAIPKYFILKEPNRIVVDVVDTSWVAGTVTHNYTVGNISQIRIGQFEEGITRFVLNWSGQKPPQNSLQFRSFLQNDGSILWQLNLGNTTVANPLTSSQTPAGSTIRQDFPPALLAPPLRGSVTVAAPPISSKLRK